MSIRDSNKVIMISNAMTGNIIIQIPYEDKLKAKDYITEIVLDKITDEEGLLIKIGSKG